MHAQHADALEFDDLESYEPDDFKAFDRFWVLIPALVACAMIISPIIAGIVAYERARRMVPAMAP